MCDKNIITVKLKEENSIRYLDFEVILPKKTNVEYAFYLFHNNVKIRVQWYTPSPSCKFQVNAEGMYHVAAFVKYAGGNPTIYTSQPYQVLFSSKEMKSSPAITLSILGSSVSRDLLEYENAANIHLSSSFQRKQILNDFNKKLKMCI